ncbi:MAG: AAA family ATPase [Anaerolineales bacterium]|jgi:cytidylate kinase
MAGNSEPKIAIVGPCASGKSTLASRLQALGYNARQIAQEHSFVPDMWQVLTQPDILIFLDASFETCTQRKQLDWNMAEYQEQQRRLRHARENCDILLDTTELSPEDVAKQVASALPGGQASDVGV